jgi:hypothetical protein
MINAATNVYSIYIQCLSARSERENPFEHHYPFDQKRRRVGSGHVPSGMEKVMKLKWWKRKWFTRKIQTDKHKTTQPLVELENNVSLYIA